MKRLNITMSDDIFKDLENLKQEEKLNRSELIRRAIILYKSEVQKKLKEKERKEKVLEAIKRINEIRESTGIWNGAREIRRFRDRRGRSSS
jgi:metal-responsive CopG/Arc/MetJ family transcriptional regulator